MKYIDQLIERYPSLSVCKKDIETAAIVLIESFKRGHITGELLKSFCKKRIPPADFINQIKAIDADTGFYLEEKLQGSLPAIALTNNAAVMTASLNDVDGNIMFAQQVNGYGVKGDVFLGISTSGNSKDIIYSTVVAKAKGLKTIALTGKNGGKLSGLADICIIVPQSETFMIQELHLPVYHALCLEIEEAFWAE